MPEHVDVSYELDEHLYAKATALCKEMGISLEFLSEAFLQFCILPENYEVVKAFVEANNRRELCNQ